jgi:hypothetical protein
LGKVQHTTARLWSPGSEQRALGLLPLPALRLADLAVGSLALTPEDATPSQGVLGSYTPSVGRRSLGMLWF